MKLPVVGYVRPACTQNDVHGTAYGFGAQLVRTADRHGLHLVRIHEDPAPVTARARPGLARAIADVARADACAVIVPTMEHLSVIPEVREVLCGVLTALGAHVVALDVAEGPDAPLLPRNRSLAGLVPV